MKILVFILSIIVSNLTFGSAVDAAKIKTVLAGEVYGDVVFVKIEPKPTTVPACQTNALYSYAFDPTTEPGKITMSMVLTAYASQKTFI